ncbi:WD40 repeat domain-containing protein [Aspergillus melleus]|uniref:WD40 repeat domain-containing protein n=1 Tax=Aspergillus melleus TaxID=138277 RepID=UPI001E8CD613|nr:Astra associated protein 1 Asa1 [Aspergillus melleus]KAH8425473.1 Astra associated protein 1 Asa1 [Aspergillus melleus]
MNHPPLTPTYILRGHASAIHSLHIFQSNLRLISADADGWIVVWDLVSKRPVAVWKGHEGAILQVRAFWVDGEGVQVYSHGRDHRLRMWKIRPQDEAVMQKTLPVDVQTESGTQGQSGSQPWMVHSLPVNALNFCAFSILFVDGPFPSSLGDGSNEGRRARTHSGVHEELGTDTTPPGSEEVPPTTSTDKAVTRLLAAPNALDSGAVDIFHLPLERRVCTIPPPAGIKPGMVMAVELFRDSTKGDVNVASGYEDGHVMVFRCRGVLKDRDTSTEPWNRKWDWETLYVSRIHTQPALSIDVSKTGGYVLSSGADAMLVKYPVPGRDGAGTIAGAAGEPSERALKTVNTKHAGQQGLRIRDDGKIFATAGWDSRVRVYSCKTMKEVAVLKWHKDGCYAVAFAHVEAASALDRSREQISESEAGIQSDDNISTGELIKRTEFSLATVQQQRNQKVQKTHWLAAGSKDGKISLWDIY